MRRHTCASRPLRLIAFATLAEFESPFKFEFWFQSELEFEFELWPKRKVLTEPNESSKAKAQRKGAKSRSAKIVFQSIESQLALFVPLKRHLHSALAKAHLGPLMIELAAGARTWPHLSATERIWAHFSARQQRPITVAAATPKEFNANANRCLRRLRRRKRRRRRP